MDLRPPRHAGRHAMARLVSRHLELELLDEVRALRSRTHERHLADEHIPELREFIEAQLPEHLANSRHPLVVQDVPSHIGVTVNPHGAELQHVEELPVAADTALTEQDRAGAADPHRDHASDEERRTDNECDGGNCHIDGPLDTGRAPGSAGGAQPKEWNPPDEVAPARRTES